MENNHSKMYEVIEYIEKMSNEHKFDSDQLLKIGMSNLNAIVLGLTGSLTKETLNKEKLDYLKEIISQILNKVKDQLWLVAYLDITKDTDILNTFKENNKSKNINIADEIDEQFSIIKKKLNM